MPVDVADLAAGIGCLRLLLAQPRGVAIRYGMCSAGIWDESELAL